MKEIKISIEDSIIDSVQQVIEPLGFDVEIVIKILLNRISRENNLSFLLANDGGRTIFKTNLREPEEGKKVHNETSKGETVRDMTKALAISIFRSKGVMLNRNTTYASKNRTAYNYWANPPYECLLSDWYLILNDWEKRELHLFKVPSDTISQEELVARADKYNQIDLQILYNDTNFRDTRSNFLFKQFHILSEKY